MWCYRASKLSVFKISFLELWPQDDYTLRKQFIVDVAFLVLSDSSEKGNWFLFSLKTYWIHTCTQFLTFASEMQSRFFFAEANCCWCDYSSLLVTGKVESNFLRFENIVYPATSSHYKNSPTLLVWNKAAPAPVRRIIIR